MQALAAGLRPGFASPLSGALAGDSCSESVITSMAGFRSGVSAVGLGFSAESVIAFMAGFETPGLVVTCMAGFGVGGHPHPPGGRTTTPVSLR
jgi:hypothetical protein